MANNEQSQYISQRPQESDVGQAVDSAVSGVANLGEEGLGKLRDAFHVAPPTPNKNGIAIAGFVLGCIALTVGFWMTGFVEIPVGIIGLVLSVVGLKRANAGAPYRWAGLTGMILTIVAAPLYLMALLLSLGLWFFV